MTRPIDTEKNPDGNHHRGLIPIHPIGCPPMFHSTWPTNNGNGLEYECKFNVVLALSVDIGMDGEREQQLADNGK